MRRVRPVISLLGTLAVGACVVAPPVGPSITALPSKNKSLTEFQQEDGACRQYASQSIGYGSPAQAAQDSAVSSAALGTVLGAAAGALLGAAAGNPGAGAAIGAGGGLLIGSAEGSNAAQYSGASLQQRYDGSYMQCMASKGNTVPRIVAAPSPYAYPYGPYAYGPYGYPAYPGYYPYRPY